MESVLQFVVFAFTAAVWWLARRDLTARAAQIRAGEAEELERLRVGVEALAADLERRAEAAEARLGARIAQAVACRTPENAPPVANARSREVEDPYAPALALADAGVLDPTEIARRTGLGRGEIELLLNLRARRAL